MIRKLCLIFIVFGFSAVLVRAQSFESISDLFKRTDGNSHTGKLNIIQDPALDTLINRYILANKIQEEKIGYSGMEGYRIQIYSSSDRNAREESSKTQGDFMNKFKDIDSYQLFAEPGYWKIRVGNFRTKTEATRLFLLISKVFPDAYIVPDIINFPELNKK
jgi:hypothetical protein